MSDLAWQPSRGTATTRTTSRALGGSGDLDEALTPDNGELLAAMNGSTPTWTEEESKAIQRELARLGLYTLAIDGDIGKGSRIALVEAFGGDLWRGMSATEVLTALQGAEPPASAGGMRYGELFKDGVLDLTVGVGFDETNAHLAEIRAIQTALQIRGYEQDATEAATLLASTGRKVGAPGVGGWFVKRDAIQYKPPVGEARSVHVVVRLVQSSDGRTGGDNARAFEEGMERSDVTMYGGHGRYGSGPDFDRNMRFELLDEDGNVTQEISDKTVLERLLAAEGKPASKSAWTVYRERIAAGTLRVVSSNAGNVFLNANNNHPGEFGANVMYDALSGEKPLTGKNGSLAADGKDDKDYRVWLFFGCRTQDYVKSIRGTPGAQDSRDLNVFASTRTLYWSDAAETLVSFLDGLVATQSATQLTEGMDSRQDLHGGEKTNVGSFKKF